MSDLTGKIAEYEIEKKKRVPAEILKTMDDATQSLKTSGIEGRAISRGDQAPPFSLPNHSGETRELGTMLAESPLVISFYRGGWCPYCNLELVALNKALSKIKALGARLVAISPETPDHSLSTMEKHALAFDVLYDKGNSIAEKFGLVFTVSEELRPIYEKFGIDIPGFNSDESFRLPVPATYVIGTNGIVAYAFVDADYTKRLEPDEIIKALEVL